MPNSSLMSRGAPRQFLRRQLQLPRLPALRSLFFRSGMTWTMARHLHCSLLNCLGTCSHHLLRFLDIALNIPGRTSSSLASRGAIVDDLNYPRGWKRTSRFRYWFTCRPTLVGCSRVGDERCSDSDRDCVVFPYATTRQRIQ